MKTFLGLVLLSVGLATQAAVLYPPVPGTGGSGGTNSTIVQTVTGNGIGVQTNSPNDFTLSVVNLDTNFFSVTGLTHLRQMMTNAAAYQALIATNTISANQLTNTLSQQMDTNVFSASGISHILQLVGNTFTLTNVIVISGANMTVVTNVVGGVTSYTVSTSASGATTNVFVAAGANVTVTTNVVGSSTIYTVAASSGAGVAVAAGPDILMSTNAGIVTISFNTNATGIATLTGTNGTVLQFGGAPAGTAMRMTNVLGGTIFQIDTNGILLSVLAVSNNVTRLYGGNTNGFMNARVNILDYGAIPDDGSDDTAAIQSANDVLVLMGGGTMYAPAGRYQISATGVKLGARVRLVGETGTDTDGGTRFSKTGAGYGFQLGFVKCEIDNIYIDGDGTTGQRGITTTNISDVSQSTTLWSLNHVRVFNCPTAYWFHNAWDGMLFDCYADVGVDGIMFSNVCSATYVFSGHYGGQETNGIHLSGGNNEGLIFNTTIEGAQIAGIFSDDTANGVDTQIEIENCWFEGNTNSVSMTNCDALRIQGCNLNSLGTNILLRGTFHVPSIKNNYCGGQSLLNCGTGTSGMELGPNADFDNNAPGIGATSYILSQTNFVVTGGGYYGLVPSGGETNAAGSRVAYLSDTGGGLTTNGYLANTNFISGKFYTNTLGGPIYVGVNANYHVSTVAGQASVALWTSSTTNSVGATGSTLDASAHDYTNLLSGWVAANEWYIFTNLLAGAGDTVTLFGGQIAMPSGTNLTGIQIINGTANQVTASTTAGVTTLSTPSVFVAPGSVTATTVINGTGSGVTNANVNTLLTNIGPYSVVANNGSAAANALIIPVSQTAVFASSTNSVQLAPLLFGTNWLLQSATPCNITNAINGTAGYIFSADITISNSTAATFTCRVDTAWIPRGWLATNIGTGTLGFNGVTVAAAKEAFIHVEARGTIETNYWLSY